MSPGVRDLLAGLLEAHEFAPEYFPRYLTLYNQAVETKLDKRGEPVPNFLNTVIGGS